MVLQRFASDLQRFKKIQFVLIYYHYITLKSAEIFQSFAEFLQLILFLDVNKLWNKMFRKPDRSKDRVIRVNCENA